MGQPIFSNLRHPNHEGEEGHRGEALLETPQEHSGGEVGEPLGGDEDARQSVEHPSPGATTTATTNAYALAASHHKHIEKPSVDNAYGCLYMMFVSSADRRRL